MSHRSQNLFFFKSFKHVSHLVFQGLGNLTWMAELRTSIFQTQPWLKVFEYPNAVFKHVLKLLQHTSEFTFAPRTPTRMVVNSNRMTKIFQHIELVDIFRYKKWSSLHVYNIRLQLTRAFSELARYVHWERKGFSVSLLNRTTVELRGKWRKCRSYRCFGRMEYLEPMSAH